MKSVSRETLPPQERLGRNIVENWLEPGLAAWSEQAEVEFLVGPDWRIPVISAQATPAPELNRAFNILLISGMHLEETSGPRLLLSPTNFTLWRQKGVNFTILPVINQYGLQFFEGSSEEKLRCDQNGVNYNDCWGDSPSQTAESILVEQKVLELHNAQPFDLVISLHEDSTHPGQGFIYLQGPPPDFDLELNQRFKETISANYLATFTQESYPFSNDIEPGEIRYGWQIINENDPTAFENWVSADPRLKIPSITVEAPFGASLEDRVQFQMDVINGAISSAVPPAHSDR